MKSHPEDGDTASFTYGPPSSASLGSKDEELGSDSKHSSSKARISRIAKSLVGNPATFLRTQNESRGVRKQRTYEPSHRWWEPPLSSWLPQFNREVLVVLWIYNVLVAVLARYTGLCGYPAEDSPAHSFCGEDWVLLEDNALGGFAVGMFLLLAFRANQAYDRFWEGRKMWGRTREVCRDYARLVCNHVDCETEDDLADRRRVVDFLTAYAVSLKLHLRDEKHIARDLLEEENVITESLTLSFQDVANIQQAAHMPTYCIDILSSYVADQTKKGNLSDYQLGVINTTVLAVLSDALGSCERIKNTPIPLSYVLQLRFFLILWLILKPLHIVAFYGWYTILLACLISFAVLGIESMACEIEEPFGYDRNDLDLDNMSQGLCKDTQGILKRHESADRDKLYDRKAVTALGKSHDFSTSFRLPSAKTLRSSEKSRKVPRFSLLSSAKPASNNDEGFDV
ncbi:UPF0187 protein [Seminavis robusta]|uniref:UPF0187 protein n=1 Tax=Seminavis robusta TaxID=568900 RepID=A0A9N8DV36_9STRA|nr:UPF0187 protein [Seminavis robusta]|eukprot:Sro374_g129230.1 UPF0187 protein (455) ;mRNA; f:21940-23391